MFIFNEGIVLMLMTKNVIKINPALKMFYDLLRQPRELIIVNHLSPAHPPLPDPGRAEVGHDLQELLIRINEKFFRFNFTLGKMFIDHPVDLLVHRYHDCPLNIQAPTFSRDLELVRTIFFASADNPVSLGKVA